MKNTTTYEIGGSHRYGRKDNKALSLSDIIQILQGIIDTKGDINMWTFDGGIAKGVKYIHLMERSDGLIGAFFEV